MTLLTDRVRLEIQTELDREMRIERASFAAKVRAARAVLGLSQEELGHQVGLTQRSVHRIEQATVEPKLRTVHAIEQFWREQGLSFEDARDGGFRLSVQSSTLIGH